MYIDPLSSSIIYIGIEADFNLLSVNYGIYLRGKTPLTGQIWKPLFMEAVILAFIF